MSIKTWRATKVAQDIAYWHSIPRDFSKCHCCKGFFNRSNLQEDLSADGRRRLVCSPCKVKKSKEKAVSLFGFNSLKELNSWVGML